MKAPTPLPDPARRDVRMDGVYFVAASADGAFVGALEPGEYSYCVMVRTGRLRLETDFPVRMEIDLGPGDAVAVSGLAPHLFRAAPVGRPGGGDRFVRRPLTEPAPTAEIDLVLGVAPVEAIALGSLMVGPIVVRRAEHRRLSRRLWAAVEMLEDEYADTSWIDSNLVIRRLAELMMLNFTRRLFDDRTTAAGAASRTPATPPIMQAINAFFRAPERVWTLPDLARAAGMSRTRFAEEFKLVTGQTPGRIIARMRLTAVAQRLASERLSVEAAAEAAGYSSAAAFVRAFQRAFGETPAHWRRRLRPDLATPAAIRLRAAANPVH
ncbi:MAG TPA: AraC family transcriptional regulator [Caulobacteraceae bacterium]|nr:AraC family transcriptional regulator [Caulobacteraceae bacterium]